MKANTPFLSARYVYKRSNRMLSGKLDSNQRFLGNVSLNEIAQVQIFSECCGTGIFFIGQHASK